MIDVLTIDAPRACRIGSAAVALLASGALWIAACGSSVDPGSLGPAGSGGSGAGGAGGGGQCNPLPPGCSDPGNSSTRIYLLPGGALAGQPIDPVHAAVSVAPGQAVEGTVRLHVENDYDSSAAVPVVWTPTWGSRQTALRDLGQWTQQDWDVPIDGLTAPEMPGAYHLVFAAAAQCGACHIGSFTFWESCKNAPDCTKCQCADFTCTAACMRWNDGADLADLDRDWLCGAQQSGYVVVKWWDGSDMACRAIGINAIEIDVLEASGR